VRVAGGKSSLLTIRSSAHHLLLCSLSEALARTFPPSQIFLQK
jgi:hypothetical protein